MYKIFVTQSPAIIMEDASSVSAIAVTAAVGAVVLLFILLCNIGKKSQNEKGKIFSVKVSSQYSSALENDTNRMLI